MDILIIGIFMALIWMAYGVIAGGEAAAKVLIGMIVCVIIGFLLAVL